MLDLNLFYFKSQTSTLNMLQADKLSGKFMDVGFEDDQSIGAFRFEEDTEKDSKVQDLRSFLKAVEAKHASNDINMMEFACHKAVPGVTKAHRLCFNVETLFVCSKHVALQQTLLALQQKMLCSKPLFSFTAIALQLNCCFAANIFAALQLNCCLQKHLYSFAAELLLCSKHLFGIVAIALWLLCSNFASQQNHGPLFCSKH